MYSQFMMHGQKNIKLSDSPGDELSQKSDRAAEDLGACQGNRSFPFASSCLFLTCVNKYTY